MTMTQNDLFTLKIYTTRKFVLKFVIIPLLWIFYIVLHIYHPTAVQKQENNHIQKSRLSLKSVHKKERKALKFTIYNIKEKS